LLALFAGNIVAAPLGTAFTYSGQLQQTGSPANAVCDFQFSLWDAATGGAQVGATLTNNAAGVSNGLFTVTLDFGAVAFTGDARWLQVAVRTNAASAFSQLLPRQSVPTTPYALCAVMAGKVAATNLIGNFTGGITLQQGAAGPTLWNVSVQDYSLSGTVYPNLLQFSAGGAMRMGIVPDGHGTVFNGSLLVLASGLNQGGITTAGDINVGGPLNQEGAVCLHASGNINASGNISAASFTGASVPNGITEFPPAGTYSFVVPQGISRLLVDVWGAGGGGGPGSPFVGGGGFGGGGGGGGAYSRGIINVTAGTALTVKVGAGGAGGYNTGLPSQSSYGGDGGDSSIASANGTVLIFSGGGKGGAAVGGTGGRGGAGGTPDPNAAIRRSGTSGASVGTAGYYPPGGCSIFCPLQAGVHQDYSSYFGSAIFITPGAGTGGTGGINPGESKSGQDGYICIQW